MSGPSHDAQLAVRPTSFTLRMRQFLPWQILRFIIINLRMTAMILKSHDTRIQAKRASGQAAKGASGA